MLLKYRNQLYDLEIIMTDWNILLKKLKYKGIEIAEPLSEEETLIIEKRYEIKFPSDLRDFLQTGMPIGKKFPNWRSEDHERLLIWLNHPRRGVLFDVEHNNCWLDEWGNRPDDINEAIEIVNKRIDEAPQLIPIYAHRMISSEPNTAGNPVISVHQTDIIFYGSNLKQYLYREFLPLEFKIVYKKELVMSESGEFFIDYSNVKEIRFWNEI